MSEPKVVHAHQWDDDEGWGHLVGTDGGYYQGAECEEYEDRRYDLVDEIPLDVAIELAHLAARVEEILAEWRSDVADWNRAVDNLADENQRLREVSDAAKHYCTDGQDQAAYLKLRRAVQAPKEKP